MRALRYCPALVERSAWGEVPDDVRKAVKGLWDVVRTILSADAP
jgi:hypothetical protein